MVEFLQNDVRHTWDTENKVEKSNTLKICKDKITNELKVIDLTDQIVYFLNEHMDYYYLDFNNKIIGTIDEYESVTINYEKLVIEI